MLKVHHSEGGRLLEFESFVLFLLNMAEHTARNVSMQDSVLEPADIASPCACVGLGHRHPCPPRRDAVHVVRAWRGLERLPTKGVAQGDSNSIGNRSGVLERGA